MAPRAHPKQLLAVGLVGVAAVALVVSQTRGGAVTTTTTTALAAPSAPTTAPTPSLEIYGTTFARQLGRTQGQLITTVAATSGIPDIDIVSWSGDSRPDWRDLPFAAGGEFELGPDGENLAFIDPHGTLWAGSGDPYRKIADDVESMAWHTSDPSRIAWITSTGRLCVLDQPIPWCTSTSQRNMVRFDDAGFFTHSDDVLVRLDSSGAQVGSLAANEIALGTNRVLASSNDDSERTFMTSNLTLSHADDASWVPEDVAGHINAVAWSPTDQMLAFLRHRGGSEWSASVYWSWGDHLITIDLDGWYWNIDWDSTGTRLVVTGVDEEAGDVAVVLDVIDGERQAFAHDGRVQSASLVTNRCFDASRSASDLSRYLDEWTDASLAPPWGVLSSEPGLESWLFLSAKVRDGLLHGEIATWAVPGFGFDSEPLQLGWLLPANDVAAAIEPSISNPLRPETHGVTDWLELDGATESQVCAAG